jgi:hypothetical protein
MDRDQWVYEGQWWLLRRRTCSIYVYAEERVPDVVTDAEVHIAGRRYSASFATPESLREVLDRWASTGEKDSGSRLWMSDLVLLPRMSLEHVLRAVEYLLLEGDFWSALDLLEEDQDEPAGE